MHGALHRKGCPLLPQEMVSGQSWREETESWKNPSEEHGQCVARKQNRQASSIWKMRMRVDHGHMQLKIVTNRDELSFSPLKIMTFVGNAVTKRGKP